LNQGILPETLHDVKSIITDPNELKYDDSHNINDPSNWAPSYYKENQFNLTQAQFFALSEHMLRIASDTWYTNGVLIELAESLGLEYLDYYQREDEGS
jgi:hypothetical protein